MTEINKSHIILLHGWGGSQKSLTPLSEELKKEGFETLILEIPGHGSTAEMPKPWSMKDFSDWLSSMLEERNIENYILVGHSFGGKLIIESLTSRNLNPKKVVLIDSNGIKPKNNAKKEFWRNMAKIYKTFEAIVPESLAKSAKSLVYKGVIGERDYLIATGNVKESFKLFNEEHYDDKIKNITIPALIIWGKDDSITPLWMGELMHQEIKNSELVVLEGTHGLPLINPGKIAKLITEFIKK